MDAQQGVPSHIERTPGQEPQAARTRRSLLAAAAAAAGALAAQAVTRPLPVSAASVTLGAANTASSATTIRNTQAATTAKAIVGVVTTTGAGASTAGVQGQSKAKDGSGLVGVANNGAGAKGVYGRSTDGVAVYGDGSVGVQGKSSGGYGVLGQGGTNGVRGEASSLGGAGVHGFAPNGVAINFGVRGSANSYAGRAVQGDNGGMDGTGVVGFAPNGTGARGVIARADQGVGLEATGGTHGVHATGATGVQGESTVGNGVYGHTVAAGASGVYGEGFGAAGYGVAGRGQMFGLWGETTANFGRGALGQARGADGIGVFGYADGGGSSFAGYFDGDVTVTGTFTAPTSFMLLDHPDSPATRWYRQAPVGSFEHVSVISGNVATGPSGRVVVRVAAIFARYHRDVRYQLTVIGQAGAAWVADELDPRGRFTIATDKPNAHVSWQLTGVRTDPAAAKAPLRVEGPKPKQYRGRYLQPELFGQPRSEALIAPERRVRGPRSPRPPKPSGASSARD